MTTLPTQMKAAVAAITALLDKDCKADEETGRRAASLLEEATISGVVTVACMLAELAAGRGDETPAEVMRKVGLAVAAHEAELDPGSFGTD